MSTVMSTLEVIDRSLNQAMRVQIDAEEHLKQLEAELRDARETLRKASRETEALAMASVALSEGDPGDERNIERRINEARADVAL